MRREISETLRKSRILIGHGHCCADHAVKPSAQTATDIKTRIFDAAGEIFVRRGIDGECI